MRQGFYVACAMLLTLAALVALGIRQASEKKAAQEAAYAAVARDLSATATAMKKIARESARATPSAARNPELDALERADREALLQQAPPPQPQCRNYIETSNGTRHCLGR